MTEFKEDKEKEIETEPETATEPLIETEKDTDNGNTKKRSCKEKEGRRALLYSYIHTGIWSSPFPACKSVCILQGIKSNGQKLSH